MTDKRPSPVTTAPPDAHIDVERIRGELAQAVAKADASETEHRMYSLRSAFERAARARLGAGEQERTVDAARRAVASGVSTEAADEAAGWLERAESQEVIIGTWASGAGEGIASRVQACSLLLARAWLLLVDPRPGAHTEARQLVDAVREEPNARRLDDDRAALERAIAERGR